MSYAIAHVIYGIPLHNRSGRPEILENALEDGEPGFFTTYTGSGDVTPGAFGVKLDVFDECLHHTEVSELEMVPKLETIQKVNDLLNSLDPEMKQAVMVYGKPRVFFLWGTS